jgi:endonuclease/exonuclease/phosphatase family metal-dependent hydrolase
MPRARISLPGGGWLRLVAAHPFPPQPGHVGVWEASLRSLPSAGTGPPWLLLGDFNATLDHEPLRRLVDSGYRDAADALGKGLIATWGPYDGDPIPPVTIDHVLVDERIRVDELSVHDQPASDHRAVVATVTLP